MSRLFTVEEANAALASLRPLAERMVAQRRELVDAEARQAKLVARIAGNGGDLSPGEVREAAEEVARAADAIAECVRKINAAGAEVKDIETGLLDFPARRGDEVVLLCWKVGEPEIAHWHGVEEGFAGRKPLPLD
jgi:hypothetical protein